MILNAIVAVDRNWGIGKKNGLLFQLPADMKFFKETTIGKTVCMGYNTLLSFPQGRPLKDRKNIVLCPSDVKREDCICVHNLNDLFTELNGQQVVYVIGGAMFYKTMLPYCSKIYVTKVDADGEAEVFYENLDRNSDFECISESEIQQTNNYNIKFTVYENKNLHLFKAKW